MLANVETWCNISKEEETMITQVQYEVLKIIFKQRDKTGIWPYKDEIMYKKLSREERIAKKILVSQTLNNRKINWYNELKMKVEKMGFECEGD